MGLGRFWGGRSLRGEGYEVGFIELSSCLVVIRVIGMREGDVMINGHTNILHMIAVY